MARWQVELTGHTSDLEDLPRTLTALELRVIEQDGRHFLEAEQFEALTESAAVHAAALALLPLIKGAAKLKHGTSFKQVGVAGYIRELDEKGDTLQHAVVVGVTMEAHAHIPAPVISGAVQEPAPPPGSLDSDEWMRQAFSNAYARRVLELWGGSHDPMNLWKLWELLRDHSGLVIDPDLVRRFRPALNDRAIAGEDARHEVPSRRYPVEPDTMSMAEAEAFLGSLLTKWLGSQP